MSFYPVFIPMMGGPAPPAHVSLLIFAAVMGTMFAGICWIEYPNVNIVEDYLYYDSVCLEVKKKRFTYIRNHAIPNLECMTKKGYNVGMYVLNQDRIEISKPSLSIEQLKKDCKECEVYSDLHIRSHSFFFEEGFRRDKRIYWDKCLK